MNMLWRGRSKGREQHLEVSQKVGSGNGGRERERGLIILLLFVLQTKVLICAVLSFPGRQDDETSRAPHRPLFHPFPPSSFIDTRRPLSNSGYSCMYLTGRHLDTPNQLYQTIIRLTPNIVIAIIEHGSLSQKHGQSQAAIQDQSSK